MSSLNDETLQELAQKVAAILDPDALLDAQDVAAMIKCSPRYVLEQYAIAPGFPRSINLTGPNGRRGYPRWRRSDIKAWIDAHAAGKPTRVGRPRKAA